MEGDNYPAPIMGLLSQIMHMGANCAKEMFGTFDLKPWQAGILFILNKEGELSQRELAERMHITPPSITTAIQKMERQGYIERKADPRDQRVLRLSITEKSKTYLEQISQVGKEMEEMIHQGMTPEERILLRRLLIQVRDNMATGEHAELFLQHPFKESKPEK